MPSHCIWASCAHVMQYVEVINNTVYTSFVCDSVNKDSCTTGGVNEG